MTSEPDSTPRRRPPTIDLTAKEVETGQGASAQQSAAADDAQDRSAHGNSSGARGGWNFAGGAKPYAVGAVVGVIAVGVIIAGIWIVGFARGHETAAAPGAQGVKAVGADEISSRLAKIQEALQAPRLDESLATRVAAAEAQTKLLGAQLAALNRRVDDVAAASQGALAQAKAATAAAEGAKTAAQAGVQRHDVDGLNNRVASLESALKSLAAEMTQRTSSADDRVARATVAAEALRATVERGAPYDAELETVKSFGVDQDATGPLVPFAADGIPSTVVLGRELTALLPVLQRASGGAAVDGSFLGRLEAHAQNLVRVTPIDAPSAPGDDPSSLIARISGDAARGDIAGAVADIGRLPDASRSIAADWIKKAEAREAAIAASRRIAVNALAMLRRPAAQ